MSEGRTYYIEIKIGLEYEGEDMPCEEALIMPIRKYARDHLRAYKKTTRIVTLDSKMRELGYEDPEEDET